MEYIEYWELNQRLGDQGHRYVRAGRYSNGNVSLTLCGSGEEECILTLDFIDEVVDGDSYALFDQSVSHDLLKLLMDSGLLKDEAVNRDLSTVLKCALSNEGRMWVNKNAPKVALELIRKIGISATTL